MSCPDCTKYLVYISELETKINDANELIDEVLDPEDPDPDQLDLFEEY